MLTKSGATIVKVAKLAVCARAAVRLARRLTGALINSTPNALVSLAHARVGEVGRVHFALEFVRHAGAVVALDEKAGAQPRAIFRRA